MNTIFPAQRRSLARTLFLNTSSNLFKFAVSVVITFVMTPIYLRALGNYDYGIWEVMGSIVGYLGLMDLGLRPTISRYMARIDSTTDTKRWQQVYSTGISLMMIAGLLVGAAFLAWSAIGPEALAENPAQRDRYALFLQLMAVQVAMSFPRVGLESALEGSQRYVVLNNVTVLHTIASSIFLFIFIDRWDPLLLLCTVNIAADASKSLLFLWLLAPPGEGNRLPSPRLCDWTLAREMYGFGFKSFAQGLATLIENRTGVLIIGALMSPATVPFYSIPQALLTKIRGLVWTLSHAMMPAFSELDAAAQHHEMQTVFLQVSRLIVGVQTLMCVGAATLGVPFIALWIGPEYAVRGAPVLYLLTACLFLGTVMPLGSRYLTALGRHGVLAKISLVRAALSLVCSLGLALYLGATGVALGVTVATVLTMPADWRAALRPLGSTLAEYLRHALLPAVVPSLAFAGVAAAFSRIGLTESWSGMMATAGACTVVYAGAFAWTGLRGEERRSLKSLLRKAKGVH